MLLCKPPRTPPPVGAPEPQIVQRTLAGAELARSKYELFLHPAVADKNWTWVRWGGLQADDSSAACDALKQMQRYLKAACADSASPLAVRTRKYKILCIGRRLELELFASLLLRPGTLVGRAGISEQLSMKHFDHGKGTGHSVSQIIPRKMSEASG
eukprot:7391095-Prymnesium_polylepis.2